MGLLRFAGSQTAGLGKGLGSGVPIFPLVLLVGVGPARDLLNQSPCGFDHGACVSVLKLGRKSLDQSMQEGQECERQLIASDCEDLYGNLAEAVGF